MLLIFVVLCIYVRNEEVPSNPNPADMGIVYPSGDTAFKALLSARFCAAIWNYISDCDETFNYWEPVSQLRFVNLRSHELVFMAAMHCRGLKPLLPFTCTRDVLEVMYNLPL
jgi:hypothetical protein